MSEEKKKHSPLKRFVMLYLVPELVLLLIRLLDWSWRYQETDRRHLDQAWAAERAPVGAFFHGRLFLLLRFMSRPRNGKWLAMCSKSLDGDAMAKIERRLGFAVVRGSSGAGGLEAVLDMIYMARDNPDLAPCLAVDGSRGPRGHVHGGVVSVAQRTGALIVPVCASSGSAHIFKKSWDRTMMPLPFAKVHVVYGEPIAVPPRLKKDAFDEIRLDLQKRMIALQKKADALAGYEDPEPLQLET